MDLPNIKTYSRPTDLQTLENWQPGWAWLAGGTWIFSEPQPQLRGLVDLEKLGWSEIQVTPEGLAIGATCKLTQLTQSAYPESWRAVKALKWAVSELASFKIGNKATIGGNLCLALPASTFAPVMVALGATYEILTRSEHHYQQSQVPAVDFPTAPQQTILHPGEVLRQIWIPQPHLEWLVSCKRICVQTSGYAVSIVVAAYNPQTSQLRFGLGASIQTPSLIEFSHLPNSAEITEALANQLPPDYFIDDERASAAYRQHVTQVLMQRTLKEFEILD